jgi:hypothetical protein
MVADELAFGASFTRRSVIQLTGAAVALPAVPIKSNNVENWRMSFTPTFVDLVRNYTMTTGTGDFVLGVTVNGYASFASALQVGDSFYYSAIGIDKPIEREVGRGTLQADGTISRDPISGIKTNFSSGIKSLSLIAAAEWFNNMQSGAGSASGGTAVAANRNAIAAAAQLQFPVLLTEAGREGLFVFDSSNLAAKVAADTYQGIYVARSSDSTGASGAWVRQIDGPIQLSWFGFADGTANNAARAESVEALLGRAVWMLAPPNVTNVDRDIRFNRPHRLTGHGMGGYDGSTPNGATVLKFPAGSTGIRVKHGGANATAGYFQLENISIAQAGGLGTTAVASYNTASPTTVTLSSGAANFADKQIVWLEGGGPSLAILDRSAAVTAGTNSVTVTTTAPTFIGNPGVYIGQQIDIAGAGLPAGTTVTAWTTTTITLSNNATATVSGASYTVRFPLVAEIQSGGGTATLTIDNPGGQVQSVTNAVLRHAPAALYSTVKVSCRDVFFGYGTEGLGAFLRGSTNDGSNADSGTFHNCYFGGAKAGVVLEGTDAQVNCFTACNFAGPEVGVLDMSLLGNYFFGCHWAFNLGIAVTYSGAVTNVVSSYLETGTSFIAANGGAAFFNSVGMAPYSGWNGISFGSSTVYNRNLEASTGTFRGGLISTGTSAGAAAWLGGTMTGAVPGASGGGWHVGSGGTGFGNWLISYNSPGGAYQRAHIEASDIFFGTSWSACDLAKLNTSGLDLAAAGRSYSINGTQVIGARISGWTAATGTASRGVFAAVAAGTASATYTASELQGALNRIATLEARLVAYDADLRTHGLIGS